MSANVEKLQHAVNRIAREGGFSTIGVDGSLGPNTNNGARAALQWLIDDGCPSTPWPAGARCVNGSERDQAINFIDAITGWSGTVDQTALAQQTAAIGPFVHGIADALKLPQDSIVVTVPGGGGVPTVPPVAPYPWAKSKSLWVKLQLLPTWQKVALGAGAGLGVLLLHKKLKQRRGARA